MTSHDPARSNRTTAAGPTSLSLRATATVAGHFAGSNVAVAADGTVYVTDANGLHAFDAGLTPKWTFATGNRLPHSPAIRRDGSIVFDSSTSDNTAAAIYAVAPDGTPIWTTNLTLSVPTPLGTVTSVASLGCDQSMYFVALGKTDPSEPRLFALSSDGAIKWTWQSPPVAPMPLLGPLDTVYGGGPTVVNPDGTPFYVTGSSDCAFVEHIAPDGTLYSGTTACTVDGWQKWTVPANVQSVNAAIGADGTLILTGNRVTAIDESGAVRWQTLTLPIPNSCGTGINSNPILDRGGTLYFALGQTGYHCGPEGTDSAPPTETLFVVDTNSGTLRTTVDLVALASCTESWELVAGSGRLYALCLDKIIALGD